MNEYLIESLEKQLQEDPKSRVFLRLAEELRKEERFEDALRVCKQGIAHHPGYMPARVCLGRVLYALKDIGQAESEFQRVVQQMPDNVHALRGLGEIALERGDVEKARTLFEQLSMFDQSVDVEELLNRVSVTGEGEQPLRPVRDDSPETGDSLPTMIEVEGLGPGNVSYGGDDEELMVGGAHRLKHLDTPAEFDAEESIDITFDREPEIEAPPDDINATIAMAAPIANLEGDDTIAVPDLSNQEGLGGKEVDRGVGEDEWGNDWEDIAADIDVSGPRDLLEEFDADDSEEPPAEVEPDHLEPELSEDDFDADPYGMQVLQSEESDEEESIQSPKPEEVSLTLAAVYEKQGHVEEALNMLRILNQREPENPEVLAAIHRMTNKLELESLNQRKIRFLQAWLAQVKDQHHVS